MGPCHGVGGVAPALHNPKISALILDYRRIILLGTVVFLLVVGGALWAGWVHQMRAEVAATQHHVQESAILLQATIKAASDHTRALARWAEDFPNHAPYSGAAEVRRAVTQGLQSARGGEFSLSNLPAEHRLGQILALTTAAQARVGGAPSTLELGVSLLDRLGAGMETSGWMRWSYFNSANQDLLVLAPWVRPDEVLDGEPGIASALAHSWTYEVTTAGLPANNPQRQPYWTSAYLDQAGAGPMVSHGVPVYWGDAFVGVVATDVQLAFLDQLLREFPEHDGVLIIANASGQILGDRHILAADHKTIDKLDNLLRVALHAGAAPDDQPGLRVGSDMVFVATLDDPRWQVIYRLPQGVLYQRVAGNYATQMYLTAALMLGALLLHLLLWHLYVSPALRIADYVVQQTAAVPATQPKVPGLWQPWLDAMAQAFADRQRYLSELQHGHELLEQRVTQRTEELLAANARLTALSVTDPLTGAFNRRYLFDLMKAEHQRVLRGGDVFSLLMMDLDYFKKINDIHGHAAGDAVLREFVRRSRESVRRTDVVCRYGGEEFVVFMPAISASGAAPLAERLRRALADVPIVFEGKTMSITVSIGVVSYRAPETIADLLARVDELLYQAKDQGRNRVMCET